MSRIPLIHVTDLYHSPQDPDDQLDLLTVAALPEFDLKAVILDCTQRFLEPAPAGWDVRRDPGYVLVAQLGHILGRTFPCALGPLEPLSSPSDDARSRPRSEQAGIDLLLRSLEASPEPVLISSVGSARIITAAFNRAPDLVRNKTRAVLLNAGATAGEKREWNVGLDPHAYTGLWRSGIRIHWYPCATEQSAFNRKDPRGTYWKASHETLFHDIPEAIRAWIAYGFSGSARGDIISSLTDLGKGAVWEHLLAGERNMWTTASLVMAAGRNLAKTPHGWRFLEAQSTSSLETWPWRLDSINAAVDNETLVKWSVSESETPHKLFGRKEGVGYGEAMAQALNALFQSIPV
ncbi:hypothetical protein QEH56_07745 [Pelagicoccus enzymogenes]|uniref:hypothetical protein n=1 Tax=Pelagicoccus enzymogenes TaxID=2773457 RepID=UPI00280E30C1|nr:hypothetical protein [Pelagicoccus enzymogenes]MDQ8198035.1 hypothetical protein [Pelagicoccus enzymogenes]